MQVSLRGTDFSKFDAHLWFVREFERLVVQEFAHVLEMDLCLLAVSLSAWSRVRSVEGVSSKPLKQQLSGHPSTSTINTLINLFHSWVAAKCRDDFFDVDGPHSLIRVAGDDKLDGVSSSEDLVNAAEFLGLTLKVEKEGNLFDVSFLSRFFYLHEGRLQSHCDFWRLLKKLHLSTRPGGLRHDELLVSKYLSVLAQDYSTPYISALAYYIVKTYGKPNQRLVLKHGIDLSKDDILQRGVPLFNKDCAASLCRWTGISVNKFAELHSQALKGRVAILDNPDGDPSTVDYVALP